MSLSDPHNRLQGLHPNLVKVVKLAAEIGAVNFTVVEGVRSTTRQAELYAQGRTKPGNKVTWVKVSNHQVKADGYGHAVDLAPVDHLGQILWKDIASFTYIYEAMEEASKLLSIPIRAGSDWDCDKTRHEKGETDDPHFELH